MPSSGRSNIFDHLSQFIPILNSSKTTDNMGSNDLADLKVEEATLRRKVSVQNLIHICLEVRCFPRKAKKCPPNFVSHSKLQTPEINFDIFDMDKLFIGLLTSSSKS